MDKIKPSCECGYNFITHRGIQVTVEINKYGNHVKDIEFGDYYDDLGENIIKCINCGKEATVVEDDK